MLDGEGMHVRALEYHDVVADGAWEESGFPGPAAATYKISRERFDEHLRALEASGVTVTTSPADAGQRVPVILTFDDGGSGYLAHAADLLEQRGWRGVVFMTTAWIGKRGFLSASDLRSLHQRGHVIGTHSRTHPTRLSALTPDAINAEWKASVADLEDALGAPVKTGSVPGGYHSRTIAEMAATNGLTSLFTSEPESSTENVDGCVVIGRYTLRRNHDARYAVALASNDPRARWGQWCQWNAKKLAKAVGGTAYLRVREQLLNRQAGDR